ncbi:hypothetical protein BU24DRAFT_429452 [Aaosphaeria arxii CBS 175.79]|uniref:DUF676 domain-containing protein n=1 Tax=Aaosphaeria arxii CBS 175.79 TaxID=1450172 RepID=A0A6A5X686_9PLEO|nr:uncharacterized protein BU24DRAFT_429452 [Aaosphaeria arxii CBS 175.79]KAF2008357.1 hypothetical protein BU24DRAFT_429452 [Aaosphaeria arxii CBS 175.79]
MTRGPVFRVAGLQASRPDDKLKAALTAAIDANLSENERSTITIQADIVPSCYDHDGQRVALVEFGGGVPSFLAALTADPLASWQIEMGDDDVNFDRHFFGFTQLYAPKADACITADVIAITGLDGHAYGSWRGKGNLGRMWLRDFLSKDLPCCRTMIYGYNSKLLSRGTNTIKDYGRELLEEIRKIRHTEQLWQRPLFFIAHSFGGIILVHSLVKAAQSNVEDDAALPAIYKATYGMLFFATPHKGLVVSDIRKMLMGQTEHPRNALLNQINEQSDLLDHQLDAFRNIIRDRKIVSFYERGQTRQLEYNSESQRWRRSGDYVMAVGTDSALLQLPDAVEEKVPQNADHSMIVKFDARTDAGYTSARDKLQRYERNALSVVEGRFCR